MYCHRWNILFRIRFQISVFNHTEQYTAVSKELVENEEVFDAIERNIENYNVHLCKRNNNN